MNATPRHALHRSPAVQALHPLRTAALLLALALLAPAGCEQVDLNAVPSAVAQCEPPTDNELAPQPIMLPGRRCLACHVKGGQAGSRAWTAAGTVYDRIDSPCNSGGIPGVKVEIADETRKVLVTLTTNSAGNFYTSEPLRYTGLIVRVSKDGKMREMMSPMGSADCATCHIPGGAAGVRVFLN